MAIQLRRTQIKDDAINADKLDLTDDYAFSGTLTATIAMGSDGNQVATKSYVDSVSQGLYWKEPCKLATTANLVITANTTLGTLTFNAGGTQAIDGITVAENDRILVKDQSSSLNNGIYSVTADGVAAGTTVILTRSLDANTATEINGAAVFVKAGVSAPDVGYVQTDEVGNLGIDSISFVQFTDAGQVTAGAGLDKTGSTLSLDIKSDIALGFSSTELNLAIDGTSLSQSAAGIKIATGGITNLMLAVDSVNGGNIVNDAIGMEHLNFSFRHQSSTILNGTTNSIIITREIENVDFQSASAFRVSRNGQVLRPNTALTIAGGGTFDGTYGATVAGSTVTLIFNGLLENTDEIDIFFLD